MTDEEQAESFSSENRRQHDRSRLIVDVHFDGGESTGVASSKDISLGGLYMSTRTEIPVGATLALRIPVAGDHVVVKGEVVYSNPGEGVGVKFRDLSDEARRSLEQELPLG
ncbi:MAG TPA: PilZ domain-containing protein [Pyrinomonadaceae bacterium]|nr:PilZ domain-containing protein [Pyrinomonadaceae bacterium]